MPTAKLGRDLEAGDVIEVLGHKRRISEIDDRDIPEPWEDWCEGLCTVRFASGGSITVFLDSYWEVF